MKTPKVTVVIACYNATRTLQNTIESVQAQTLTDWELIIVNDGSTDGSLAMAQDNAKQDARIHVLDQINQGPSPARNKGVSHAKAPIIAFLDSDDLWRSDHLAKNLAVLEGNSEIGVSYGGCEFLGHDGAMTGDKSHLSTVILEPEEILAANPTTTCSALVFRKEVYEAAGGLRDDMKFAEDQEWLFRVMMSGWDIGSANAYTLYYQTSTDGLSANLDKMAQGWEQFMGHAKAVEPDLVQKHYEQARSEMSWYHARRSLRTVQPFYVTWKYLWRSLVASPKIILRKPLAFMLVSLASLFPKTANQAQYKLKSYLKA